MSCVFRLVSAAYRTMFIHTSPFEQGHLLAADRQAKTWPIIVLHNISTQCRLSLELQSIVSGHCRTRQHRLMHMSLTIINIGNRSLHLSHISTSSHC